MFLVPHLGNGRRSDHELSLDYDHCHSITTIVTRVATKLKKLPIRKPKRFGRDFGDATTRGLNN